MPSPSDPGGGLEDDAPSISRWERLKYTLVREDTSEKAAPAKDRSVDEIEADVNRANDKERAIGLVAAPIAALVAIIIGSASIDYARSHHQSLTIYDELTYVLLGLSVLILVTAWLRKRLFLGIALSLYGLAVFNLHYWGFGVPFLMVGAWYLVRAYRISQELKRAEGNVPPVRSRGSTSGARPRPNKRYTPRA
jgi:hypothetical protein